MKPNETSLPTYSKTIEASDNLIDRPAFSEDIPEENVKRSPCVHCNRFFNLDRITFHQSVCVKSRAVKRDVFDSFSQRVVAGSRRVPKNLTGGIKQTRWRQESAELRRQAELAKSQMIRRRAQDLAEAARVAQLLGPTTTTSPATVSSRL